LWWKPHMNCVLNFIITGKSSSMLRFISWSKRDNLMDYMEVWEKL
jgi:hypothetical protein